MTDVEWTRTAVMARVAEDFPAEDAAAVLALLDEAVDLTNARGAARIQLAILTLSKGNADRLLDNIDTAKKDWRDVLYWAECPPSVEERERVGRLIEELRADGKLIETRDRP